VEELFLEEGREIGGGRWEQDGSSLIDDDHVVDDEVIDVAGALATRGARFDVQDIALRFQLIVRFDEQDVGIPGISRRADR
jgi:hypothetical protein